jgi:hypothetical protein
MSITHQELYVHYTSGTLCPLHIRNFMSIIHQELYVHYTSRIQALLIVRTPFVQELASCFVNDAAHQCQR